MRTKPTGDGHLEQALLSDEKGAGSMLQEYAAEYARLRKAVMDKLKALRERPGSAEVKEVEDLLAQIRTNSGQVKVQLKLELSGAPAGVRQEWDSRLQEWNRELQSFKTELEALKTDGQRRALQLPAAGSPFEQTPERQAAMQSTELLERSTGQLEKARLQALETEQIAQDVMSDLVHQRGVIEGIQANTREIDDQLSQAQRVLGGMMRVAQRNRVITLMALRVVMFVLMVLAMTIFGVDLKISVPLAAFTVIVTFICQFVAQKRREASSNQS